MSAVIPFIDPRVRRTGVSGLRDFDLDKMREFAKSDSLLVIHQSDREMAVMVPYDMYQEMAATVRGFAHWLKEQQ